MKKISYLLITFVSVLSLMVASVEARGREGGGGGHGGGGSHGGAARVGGGGHGGGGGRPHGGRAAFHGGGGRGTTKQFTPSVNRSSNIRSGPSSQFHKQSSGGYSKPTSSGQKQFQGQTGTSRQFRGQTGQGKQTQGQVQRFLNMPKNNTAQTRTGLGKKVIGAAALGAGAVALHQYAKGGSVAGINSVGGHTPQKGASLTNQINPQRSQQLRNSYSQRYSNAFNGNWWNNHSYLNNYGGYGGWGGYGRGYWWGPATWLGLSSWIPWGWGSPLYYDYGSNFYYDNDSVYLNGRRLCSAPEYYDQAVQIIDKAPKVTNNKDQWMPLGVFAVTQDAKKASDMVFQLAVNKEGAIQGTYFNSDDNTAKPIKGMVDKESERAVWTFADKNKNAVIMETGIYNLTKDQTGVLVHFGKERTQEWLMVRLNEPSDKEKQTAPKTAE